MSEEFKKVFLDAQKRIQGREKERDKSLEGISYECPKFSAETVNHIILIRQGLRRVTANLDFPKALDAAQRLLDSQKWKAKFTTGSIEQPNKDTDSIYYLTPEGISFRLNMHNAGTRDIKEVIRSCKEVVTFDNDDKVYFDPAIGLSVQEYVSPEFLAIQDGPLIKTPYRSKIRIYRGNPTFVVNVPNGFTHPGHKVNRIM